tara:strand:- start:9342 stop:9491 length:150 start_codon:yes stop_codon:yes gene_type:complete
MRTKAATPANAAKAIFAADRMNDRLHRCCAVTVILPAQHFSRCERTQHK